MATQCGLTMPLGPSVDFTRSAIAIAPTEEACGGREAPGNTHLHGQQVHGKPKRLQKMCPGSEVSLTSRGISSSYSRTVQQAC